MYVSLLLTLKNQERARRALLEMESIHTWN